jgi:DDE superfamily endonuclease
VITHRATLDVPGEPAQFVAGLLLAERRRRGTPRGSRALTCFWQAVPGLRWFRDRTAPEALARDHGVSRASAYRYLDEVITVLAGQGPELRQALERARHQGLPHVILDGTVIPCDRCKEPALSVKGEVIDLWYSGKAHCHGGNLQAVTGPDGFPLWVSEVEPGSGHDITAARLHALPALYHTAAQGLPTLADPGYEGTGTGIHIPSNSTPADRNPISIPAPATPSSVPCAAWANAASPCSPAAGAPCGTSPPAPAKSATSPAPHSPGSAADRDPRPRSGMNKQARVAAGT